MNIKGWLASQPLDAGEPISLLDSPGHLALGDAATLTLLSVDVAAWNYTLATVNENGTTTNLTYPWILTLGADFFVGCALTEVTQAICNGTSSSDQLDRFKKKYAPLLSYCDGTGSSAPIHDLCKYVIAQSSMIQMMWQANNNESWKAYFVQIGGETKEDYFNQTVYPSAIGFGRYLIISAHGFDHFALGSDAATAYTVAHGTAVNQAIVASSRGNIADLNAAYAMNVLADHYLSDMFSTGHLRAPR